MSDRAKYRAVIDTNVFVSSFFGGIPREIINRWKNGQVLLCLSQDIVEEYLEVLIRLDVATTEDLNTLIELFAHGYNCLFAAETPDLLVIQDDPDDNKFLECAVALEAKIIVSGDQHLRKLSRYIDIQIISPREFLDVLEKENI